MLKLIRYETSILISITVSELSMIAKLINDNALSWLHIVISILPVLFYVNVILSAKTSRAEIVKFIYYLAVAVSILLFWTNNSVKVYAFINQYSITAFIYLVLMFIFAIIFPKLKPNGITGIRTFLTLEYPEVWTKAHRAGSVILVFGLIPQFLTIFYIAGVMKFVASNAILLGCIIVSGIYSEVIGRPIAREKERIEQMELREQIKKESGWKRL